MQLPRYPAPRCHDPHHRIIAVAALLHTEALQWSLKYLGIWRKFDRSKMKDSKLIPNRVTVGANNVQAHEWRVGVQRNCSLP